MYYPKYAAYLNEMPFDKYVDGEGYIHATGRAVLLTNEDYDIFDLRRDIWVNEYEDNAYDVPTLYQEDDNGELVPFTEEELWEDMQYIEDTKEWIFQNDNDINFEEGDIIKCAREG